MASKQRSAPNILISGTPGVGKSSIAQKLAEKTGCVWQDVSRIAKENDCLEDEYDDERDCPVIDETKLIDFMEDSFKKGGNIVEYHSADMFPPKWFDLVIVLRTNNTVLYDRLSARGYNKKKLEENIQCEIFQMILDEARCTFNKKIIHELENDTEQQMEENVKRVCELIEQWKANHTKI